MKYGMRKPSIKKSLSARTTGKITRSVKKATNPLYGKKGVGMIKDPEKAIKNKVYHKTTVGISDIAKSSTKSSSGKNNSIETNATYQTPQKSKGSCWTIFLWILFFPIMLTVWLWKTDKISDKRVRIGLIAALWVLIILYYIFVAPVLRAANEKNTATSTTSAAQSSSETTEEEVERLYDNEDENLDAILSDFNKFSDKKITKDMVDNASSNRWKCKVDFGDALLKINFQRLFDIDERSYYFSLTQPDGDAEIARPYYLALFQALYPEADIDTLNQMYDDMNAIEHKNDVDVFIYGCDVSSWIDNDDSYGFSISYDPANQDRTTAIIDKYPESTSTESTTTE